MEVIVRADDKRTMQIPENFIEEWNEACARVRRKYGKHLKDMPIVKESKAAGLLRREITDGAKLREEVLRKADRWGIDRIELDKERKKQRIAEIETQGVVFWWRKRQ